MTRLRVVIIILILLVIFGGYWYWQKQNTNEADQSSVSVAVGEVQVAVPETTGETEMVYGVSLTSFKKQEFKGENLRLGKVLADNNAYTRYYITYESNGLTISGIMNIPKGDGPFPVLLLNHGYIDPAVYTNGRGLKREQDYLARQGYVVLHSDYRNHADSDKDPKVDEELRLGYAADVVNAALAVRSSDLPYFDKENIGMLGHSMGGGVALQIMTTRPDIAKAYVLLAPVSADARDNFDKWIRRGRPAAAVILEKYGDFQENPKFWSGISPDSYFENITAPVLYHHGTSDESVPLAWSEKAYEKMRAKGVDVTLHIYENEPHEFVKAWPLVMQRTVEFFDQHLRQ